MSEGQTLPVSERLHTLPGGDFSSVQAASTETETRDVIKFPAVTGPKRRGPNLSRRIGQNGNVFQRNFHKTWDPTAPAYGRYYTDADGERPRKVVALGICRTRSIAKAVLREHIERAGVNSAVYFREHNTPAITFRQQAKRWLESLATRRRRPLKPATIANWRHSLNKWLLPNLGDKPLAQVGNGALKELVAVMMDAGLSAKSINTHTQVVKLVVASAVDSDGNQLFQRTWNAEFCDIPVVRKEEQERQTTTAEELQTMLANLENRDRMLNALMAGTGLRAGEVLALSVDDLSPDGRIITVRHGLWRNQLLDSPKTANGSREVDVPEPLATMLADFVRGRAGFVFATASGKPLSQRNALRALHSVKKIGFHALRRFRAQVLLEAGVPELLRRWWLGHSAKGLSDLYAMGLTQKAEWRREWCDKAGLGFDLGYLGYKSASENQPAKAA